jgi:ABC-2 type transport system ATP-binding protein
VIKASVREGKTVFLASHMLHEVKEICDSVALIDKGILLAYDSIENLEKVFEATGIYVEPLHPMEPRMMKRIEKLQNVRAVVQEGKGLTITFKGSETDRAQLLTTLVKELSIPIVSFRPSLEALEEVYLQLIKEGN